MTDLRVRQCINKAPLEATTSINDRSQLVVERNTRTQSTSTMLQREARGTIAGKTTGLGRDMQAKYEHCTPIRIQSPA
jgi:hypothetical protein